MSNNLPANFNAEKAGVKQTDRRCDRCDRAPCECKRLEDKMDEKRRR